MKKKIQSILLAFVITISMMFSTTFVVLAGENTFDNWMLSCLDTASGIDYNDQYLTYALGLIKDNYYHVYNTTEFPAEDGTEEFFSFVLGISYMYYWCDEGTVGFGIGEKGWDAIRELYKESGQFKAKMDEFKTYFEENMETKIYETSYSSGQYKTGTDIPAGEYMIFSDGSSGYFAISTDSNGADIIANENFEYNSILTINDGEYLELSRCYAVPIEYVESIELDKANMIKIGLYLPAGEYKLTADSDMGYYAIYNDSRHQYIVANNNFQGQSYVTVSDGQYLLLSRCHIEQQ